MIKIRYRNANELPPGLHATAERHGRTITIYLLPGLAAEERNAALRRLRLSGRMGHGPRLPGVQLGFALFADRVRATIGQARHQPRRRSRCAFPGLRDIWQTIQAAPRAGC